MMIKKLALGMKFEDNTTYIAEDTHLNIYKKDNKNKNNLRFLIWVKIRFLVLLINQTIIECWVN